VSDLVAEFPELQGTMGKYFAIEQGFEKDVSSAISDHYLPNGLNNSSQDANWRCCIDSR